MIENAPELRSPYPFVDAMIADARAPFDRIIETVLDVNAREYLDILQRDSDRKADGAVRRYLARLSVERIEDIDLAWDMARAENIWQLSRITVRESIMDETVQADLLAHLDARIAKKEKDKINAYREGVNQYLDRNNAAKVEEPAEKPATLLDALTPEEIEAKFHTQPISRQDFLSLGLSAQATGRAWVALTRMTDYDTSWRSSQNGRKRPLLRSPVTQLDTSNWRTNPVEFVGFYQVVQWAEAYKQEHPNDSYSRILTRGVGKATMEAYRDLIASRAQRTGQE